MAAARKCDTIELVLNDECRSLVGLFDLRRFSKVMIEVFQKNVRVSYSTELTIIETVLT